MWDIVKISDFCEVGRGSSPRPIIDQRYFEGGDIPWIKIADATTSGKFIYETREYVNEFGASFSRYLEPGSLIVAASGSLGQIKFLGVKGCIHDGWLYLSKYNDEKIDKEYLYHALLYIADTFESMAYGAAIQNINTDILRETKIPLPPLPLQQRIAAVLGRYDELLDNYQKQVTAMNSLAQEIYREWFLRGRGPEVLDDIEGELPTGWSTVELSNMSSLIQRGITPSYDDEGEILCLNQRCIRENRIDYSTGRLQNKNPGKKVIQFGDILINSTGEGTLGRTAQVYEVPEEVVTVDTHVTIARPAAGIPVEYYGFLVTNLEDYFVSMALGATGQTELSREAIGKAKVIKPTVEAMQEFSRIVAPMKRKTINLLCQMDALRTTRDALLPRLLSGQLAIDKLALAES
jgi:type I restriction enzyme S subunit